MAVRQKQFHGKIWLHWLGWALVAAALFYGMHRYFEYRERELDKRLEQLN